VSDRATERDQRHEPHVSLFVVVIIIYFFWVFEQRQSVDRSRRCRRSSNCGGGRRSRLSGSIQEVPEPGGRNHTSPFRLLKVPGQASRSYPRKAHDSGTRLLRFSLSNSKIHFFVSFFYWVSLNTKSDLVSIVLISQFRAKYFYI
jgi:hypothetical protein